MNNLCLRESCYNCACKGGKSLADISLGDFWGIENIYSEMDDDRGISAIILHNTKSIKIWETISINSIMKECKIYDILQSNSPYLQSVPMPSSRNYFISNYNRTDMATLVEKCLKTPFYKKLINILKSIVNHYGNKAKNN